MKEERDVTAERETLNAGSLLEDFLKTLKRLWYVVLIVTLLAGGAMYGWSKLRFVPQYRSQASFAVDTSTSSVMGDGSLVMEQIKESLPYVLTSEHMKNMVCSELKLDSFPASIEVSANEYANLFTLTVTAGDPNLSNEILQSLLDNFPRASVYVMGRVSLKTLDVSGVPTEPYNSRECIQNAERGAICGLALSVIFVFIRSLYSKTVCDPEDFKKNLNLTCIAAVPHIEFKKRRRSFDRHVHIHNEKVGFGFTESFRTMRIRTERECAKRGDRCIFVTSSISGEGKSTVASNIALALASKGRRVILLDCDFRNPSVVKTLGLDIGKRPGIADVLSGKAAVPEALMHMENWGLDIIPGTAGRSEPASLIGSGRLTRLLEHLKKVYDFVIVDTPPAAMLADAMAMAEAADCAVYIVKQDWARLEQITEGLDSLSVCGVRLLGAVLNDVKTSVSGYGRYGYGYGKYGKYGKYGVYGTYGSRTSEKDGEGETDDEADLTEAAKEDAE